MAAERCPQAMILAGGFGTRLQPALQGLPKCLAPVAGRPFLSYLLDRLAEAGCKRVVLCTGYLASQVEQAFGDSYSGMTLQYSVEDGPLGTAGAARNALPLMEGEEFLLLNGDSFCPWEALPFLGNPLDTALASLLLVEVDDVRRFGTVSLQEDGRILHFFEKGVKGGAGLINAGVYRIHRDLLLRVPRGENLSLENQVFPSLARAGRLTGQVQYLPFIDIGTPESYAQAESFFSPEPRV
ncbi:MAG TPA: hypothetical protein ENK02_04750 [Planctomycetes bacterium]|nr:hypothetical protein [Planctomycetota bacterium]